MLNWITVMLLHTEEYAFAGHPFDDTGVYEMTPRNEDEVCGSVKFRYDNGSN